MARKERESDLIGSVSEDLIKTSEGLKPAEKIDEQYGVLPQWNRLRNTWLDSQGRINNRPHYMPVSQHHSIVAGVLYNNDNGFMYIGDGVLYDSTSPESTIAGTSRPVFDVSRLRTIITAGSTPLVYQDESTFYELPFTDVKSVATFIGAQKLRLVFVKSTEPNRLYVTAIGDLTDTGTVIIDPELIADDEYTEGFSIKNVPYDIIDMVELNNRIMIFTARGIFSLDPDIDENGFNPTLQKRINVEIVDSRVAKDEGQVWFIGTTGPMRLFFEDGFPTFRSLPMIGNKRTMLSALNHSQATINVDKTRDILFFKPNNADDRTFVFHFLHEVWHEWSGGIDDVVSVAGVTYFTLNGGNYAYKFDDDGNGSDEIEIRMNTGLMPLADLAHRKRLRHIYLDLERTEDLEYFEESEAVEF